MRTLLLALAAALLVAAALTGSGALPLSGKTLFAIQRDATRTTEIARIGDTRFAITRKQPQRVILRADRTLGYWLLGAGLVFALVGLLSRKR